MENLDGLPWERWAWSSADSIQEAADFEKAVRTSLKNGTENRVARLKVANRIPRRYFVLQLSFRRNPDVVAEVLERACGRCESCRNSAPFFKASDGTPYLEVHHKQTLANGGEDTVENAVALCPNCHRRVHHGVKPPAEK
ncbi:MAG: HNH endonuclease [Opitutus sp.]|nr:HNH endonuclease [Opitutus sp.]